MASAPVGNPIASPADGYGPPELLAYRSAQGRWVLAAMVLGSSVAGIDSTVVAVALPAIGRNLQAGFAGLQWTVTAYTLTLLIAARAVQGIGGALMTPASLAIIQAAFQPGDRTRAIGIWAGFSGVSLRLPGASGRRDSPLLRYWPCWPRPPSPSSSGRYWTATPEC
jgi:Major Facilitator Superfamily